MTNGSDAPDASDSGKWGIMNRPNFLVKHCKTNLGAKNTISVEQSLFFKLCSPFIFNTSTPCPGAWYHILL
jgi:hypothetical protein